MPSSVHRVDVLIASPSDARPARDAIEQALHEWNVHRGDEERVILRPLRWEVGSVPVVGQGDAQSVINQQLVDKADIVIGIFYHRLGTSTPRAISGTAEEIDRSVRAGKQVHIYFAEVPPPYSVDLEQFKALKGFKERIHSDGLVGTFELIADLKVAVLRAIELDVQSLNIGSSAARKNPLVAYEPPTETVGNRRGKMQQIRVTHLGPDSLTEVEVLFKKIDVHLKGPSVLWPNEPQHYHSFDRTKWTAWSDAREVRSGRIGVEVEVRWKFLDEARSATYFVDY